MSRIISYGKLPFIALTFSCVLVGSGSSPALSDEDISSALDRIVVTASRSDARHQAGSAHFISSEDIELYEYNDINRMLRAVPGINIQEEDGYGLRPNIGLRGTGLDRSSKIALMEDGILIAPAPYAAPSAYYFPRAGRMSAIEVTKGAAAIKYGPLTTGGALHLFSTPLPDEFGGKVDFLIGENNQSQIHANIGNTTKLPSGATIGFLLETFQDRSDGFKSLDSGGDTGFDFKDYVGKLKFSTAPGARFKQSLELKLQYSDETSDETYLGLTQADFNADENRRYRASQLDQFNGEHNIFQLTHTIAVNDSIDLTTIAYRTQFQRNWYKLEKAVDAVEGLTSTSSILNDPLTYADAYATLIGGPGTISANNALQIRANNREYYAQGIQSVLGVSFDLGQTAHEAEFSVRYHEDEIDRYQWFDGYRMDNGVLVKTSSGVPGTESNRINTAKAWSFFIQDEISWGAFTLTPGLRYESIKMDRRDYGKTDPGRTGSSLNVKKNTVDVFIPGFGITYDATDALLLLAGIHKGFSPPSPGSASDPEESINYEAGLRYSLDNAAFELIGFYNDYSNLVGTCTASTGGGCTIGDQFDGGEVDVKGFEATANWDLGEALKLDLSIPLSLSYTYTDTEFQTDFKSGFGPWSSVTKGDEIPYIANQQLNLGIGIVGDRWQVNTTVNYISETRSAAGHGSIPLSEKIDGRTIIDASASYDVTEQVSLYAKAENLFDETYVAARRPSGLRPGKPQTLSLGLKLSF